MGRKTRERVYDYLPRGVYEKIKRCKVETGSHEKLHQFLSEDGLKIREEHQRLLLILMGASAMMTQLKTLLDQACSRSYQLLVFEWIFERAFQLDATYDPLSFSF